MKAKSSKEIGRILLAGFTVAIAVMCGFGDVVMCQMMLSSWAIPVVLVMIVTVALIMPLRKMVAWLTGSDKAWFNIACHVVVVFPLLLMGVLLSNMLTSTPSEEHQISGTVERLYKQTRYHTKRVSRRVYTRGAPYKVNRMEVALENGKTINLDVNKKVYNSAQKGDTVDIPVEKGIFGLKWMRQGNLKLRHERPARKSCRTVGPATHSDRARMEARRHRADSIAARHRARIDSLRRKFNH